MAKIRVRDIELYYEISGQGEPLVFIHGLGSSSRDWEYQIEYFARDFKVIVFDLRGHGRSDKPKGPYTISLMAEDTAALIKEVAPGPVHLVGISLGGMIALQLGIDSPELIKSLIVVNAVSEVKVKTLKEKFELQLRLISLSLLGMRNLGKLLAARLFPNSSQQKIRDLFAGRWAENDPSAYRATLKAIIGWGVTEKLHKLNAPLLVIAAEHDYTPVSAKSLLVSRVKQAQLIVIRNSRHGTPVDQPEAFNLALSTFLVQSG
ncbi:MAG: alpha/beta fold hydrolase [Deltaproteobacteria bacterium]|nr:alpha/beta fold hydrolase [Deltaproteobacteria bacterium]